MLEKKKLLLLALYRHHTRYFRLLLPGTESFNSELRHIACFLFPPIIRESPTPEELRVITRYTLLRKQRQKWVAVRPLFAIYRVYQYLLAKIIFSNCLYYFKKKKIDGVAVWNGQNLPLAAAVAAARRLGIRTLFFENGPLPATTMLDPKGINFENSLPRDPTFYRNVPIIPEELKKLLQTPLIPRAPKKKSINEPNINYLPSEYYFLPFQVYSDTQVLLFSPWISDMESLARIVLSSLLQLKNPPALVIKEHPSCRKDYSFLRKELSMQGVVFANNFPTMELILKSNGVITINSSVGIEALLLGKPVLTLGQAFYNIEGLVLHANSNEELIHALERLRTFKPDQKLREGFLYYLKYHYLLPGSHRSPNSEHILAVRDRLDLLLSKKDN